MKKETNAQQPNLIDIEYHFPSTWPADGPIDLNIHDLPHHESLIEWWYQNCHLRSKDGKQLSLFASFFRVAVKEETTGNLNYTHSVIWSLSDKTEQKYYRDALVDPTTPAQVLKAIKKNEEKNEGSRWIRRALKEVYEKGNTPLPDRLLKLPANIGINNLSLEYDENSFKKDEHGNYHLKLENPLNEIVCKLSFTPLTKPIRHGIDGVVSGIRKEEMFYYFIPKCEVSGEIQIGNTVYEVEGSGWYDHEFSRPADETSTFEFKQEMDWNWIALQLDNGYQLSGYDLFDNTKNGEHAGGTIIIINPDGERISTEDYSFLPEKYWTSARTFISYPVSWKIEIPLLNIYLSITADFPEQEFITILSAPAFWEGSVSAEGKFMDTQVSGQGYIERNGFSTKTNIESFLKAVGDTTQKSVESLMPLNPSDDQFYKLVNSPLGVSFLSAADKEQYVSSVIKPIREIVDRSKKAWRSYIFLACIDSVGGNSQPFIDWLAMPEFIHTGSLIVDDVQDRSDTRRGGSALHLLYGETLAINAGNASYFISELFMHEPKLPDDIRIKVYELYFEMMRAAHAGQAMDISGLHDLMPEAVYKGNSSTLENRIYTIHRLKTATPACTLAKLGGLIGGGKPEEIEALSSFLEAIGVAYQIMDDVLNLQGYENNLKDKGEDITAGKITMPVAKAMGLMPLNQREYVWETIQTLPTDRAVIASVIHLLQDCGAIEACRQEADELVEAAWEKLDKLLPDSFFKVRLRAFGWYALKKE
ncbi:geranylgeranyl pyrophosphate synthase/predicted secreted hydrolase [Flavobacterium sp. 2755]|uniref:polyprenyl synthetase family protein n=1 Tax=Flavobacterium sp. 2755 TaxID=2817765 RepID=UPI00285FF108|nr:polyprenyl synthetase family protein [Flavobacterium sp. 2755]MDR6759987.1 geranylgeranyl pyrophosphate synthase/predicted secreted hydrolase [Flavobacterium sp. 2755]